MYAANRLDSCRSRVLACVLGALVLGLGSARAQDDSEQPWLLEFKPVKVRMITPRQGPGQGKTYWYLVYTVENNTGADRDFYLSITAKSDRGKRYADLFLPSVERAIERQERRELWGKADKFEALAEKDVEDDKYAYTTIRDGEKRTCVAVFNRLDSQAKAITISVSGLTNDLEIVPSDTGGVEMVQRVRLVHLERPGDEYEITNDSFRKMRLEWTKVATKVDLEVGN